MHKVKCFACDGWSYRLTFDWRGNMHKEKCRFCNGEGWLSEADTPDGDRRGRPIYKTFRRERNAGHS